MKLSNLSRCRHSLLPQVPISDYNRCPMRICKMWRKDNNPIRVIDRRLSKEQRRMMVKERLMMLEKAKELHETDHNSDKLALPVDHESETNQETLSEHELSEATTSKPQSGKNKQSLHKALKKKKKKKLAMKRKSST